MIHQLATAVENIADEQKLLAAEFLYITIKYFTLGVLVAAIPYFMNILGL